MGAGFNVGAFAVVPFIGVIRLQPEIHYERRTSDVGNSSRTYDYITVPVLVRMDLFFGLYVTEGPSFNFPVRARVKTGGASVDVKNNTTTPDFSILIGVGRRIGRLGSKAAGTPATARCRRPSRPATLPPGRALSRDSSPSASGTEVGVSPESPAPS